MELCKGLEIDIEEIWADKNNNKYKVDNSGMIWFWDEYHREWEESPQVLPDIMSGTLKLRWYPKDKEMYFVPVVDMCENVRYFSYIWTGHPQDIWSFTNGLVFKTKEEAIEIANKMLEVATRGF